MFKQIYQIIQDELQDIECRTCSSDSTFERCHKCHRRYLGWRPSDEKIFMITSKIIMATKEDGSNE